ncbi:MAG TPA: HAMP domain-containing sensor histidine kinase [Thermoanaerobaculia bacterium]|nr:HAMP domain-containing sensor histidine kinase [Thermoanaerobaculia bacterium]
MHRPPAEAAAPDTAQAEAAVGVDFGAPEFRILIFAPVGRTAELARDTLRKAGLAAAVCVAMDEFCAGLRQGAGAALLVEEALSSMEAVRLLADTLAGQPAWSDCSVQVFVADSETPSPPLAALAGMSAGRSVVLLDRPVPPASLISVMRAALHNRARQYALRDLLGHYEEARADADAANRAKGEFLSVMSHELRTPLNAIGGYTELIEMGIRGPVTPQQRADLERIRLSQKHLLGLVNEVLNYTKLETGTVEYDIQDVPVREAFIAAEALVVPQARAKGLELITTGTERFLAVRADPDKLRQILVNLLSNAVKFTGPGGRIHLGCERAGECVCFSVRDTGVGIPADKVAAVFEPFVQVRSDLTRTQEGTGLGLAISRQLARGMGGNLVVESTPGEGSVFTLKLPA